MPVRRTIHQSEGIYFITFTCTHWLNLFQLTNSYDLVYNWFDFLIREGHYIVGYTVMLNHVHVLIAFTDNGKSINTTVGNGKRFIAYELVERLKKNNFYELLKTMNSWVNPTAQSRNKKHEVFEPSFDWKECNSEKFVEQKLYYIHENASKGERRLVDSPEEYEHSSARFYILDEPARIKLTTWLELQDIDLT